MFLISFLFTSLFLPFLFLFLPHSLVSLPSPLNRFMSFKTKYQGNYCCERIVIVEKEERKEKRIFSKKERMRIKERKKERMKEVERENGKKRG